MPKAKYCDMRVLMASTESTDGSYLRLSIRSMRQLGSLNERRSMKRILMRIVPVKVAISTVSQTVPITYSSLSIQLSGRASYSSIAHLAYIKM